MVLLTGAASLKTAKELGERYRLARPPLGGNIF